MHQILLLAQYTLYSGYMDEPKGDEHWVTMTVKPFPLLEREYPKRVYQIGCNWTFGNSYCGVNRATYKEIPTVVACTTEVISHNGGGASDYYVPGFIEVLDGDYQGTTRPILNSEDGEITLRVHLEQPLEVGTTFILQKTCAKNPDYCTDVYNNYAAYGGFPRRPQGANRVGIEPVLDGVFYLTSWFR